MEGVLWAVVLAAVNIPIATLLLDRIFAVPAARLIRFVWLPGAVVLAVALGLARSRGVPLPELVWWGAVGGFVATVGLDVVRLIGLHVFRAFPVDMPQVFGLLALDLGPRLQENVIAAMVGRLAAAPPAERHAMLAERLEALARLPQAVRVAVVRAMRKGVTTLPEERRQELVATQMSVLATLPPPVRRSMLQTMDLALDDGAAPVYQQPRGLPRVPMQTARALLAEAVPETVAEAGVPRWVVMLAGYGWHVLNGLGFGITYTLLFGQGTWALAVGWGLFIWAGMMATMPIMMPTIRFPIPGFWVVPFIAHLVMAVPIGYYALRVSQAAHQVSLLGAWLR